MIGGINLAGFKYIRRGLSQKLELPEDSLGSAYRLQLIGDTVILCGCRKLLKYKSEEIAVLAKDAVLRITGEHLKCLYFFENTIEISGSIQGIGIEKR